MPIEGTERVATDVARVGCGATTPSGGGPRTDPSRSREGLDRPGGARCQATATGGARRASWCALSTVLADLRARLGAAEDKAAHLEFAMVTNRRIGIAVGILMCRLRVTEDQAFAVLCKHSQDHNVKVRDLAEEVIYTGSL
jgi:ANTAR domain